MRGLAGLLLVLALSVNAHARPRNPVAAELTAVCFRGAGKTAEGCTSPFTVRVIPNTSGRAAVGVMEEFLGASGNQWRSAAWIAAFNASMTLGRPLQEHRFIIETQGHIDGPSAGLLTTSSMMALMLGEKLRRDTTMTGAVNPDGSAGPVGGIPLKMEGARRAGLRRFGFPLGQRMSVDPRTGEAVDLYDLGRKLGLEVREIKDVFDALEFMTGRRLKLYPEPPARALELSSAEVKAIERARQAWLNDAGVRAAAVVKAVNALPPKLKAALAPMLLETSKYLESSTARAEQGYLTASYVDAVRAMVTLNVITRSLEFIADVEGQHVQKLMERADDLDRLGPLLDRVASQLTAERAVRSVPEAINALGAYSSVQSASAYLSTAKATRDAVKRALLAGKKLDFVKGVTQLQLALVHGAIAEAYLLIAAQQAAAFPDTARGPRFDRDRLASLSRSFASAAGAGLGYLDALWLENDAGVAHLSKEQQRAVADDLVLDYRLAHYAALRAEYGASTTLNDELLRLAAGIQAYSLSAKMVLENYSLQLDPKTGKVRQTRALNALLDLARDRARAAAGRAHQKVGFIPLSARMNLGTAEAHRGGSDEERIQALTAYWSATLASNLAVLIAAQ